MITSSAFSFILAPILDNSTVIACTRSHSFKRTLDTPLIIDFPFDKAQTTAKTGNKSGQSDTSKLYAVKRVSFIHNSS